MQIVSGPCHVCSPNLRSLQVGGTLDGLRKSGFQGLPPVKLTRMLRRPYVSASAPTHTQHSGNLSSCRCPWVAQP